MKSLEYLEKHFNKKMTDDEIIKFIDMLAIEDRLDDYIDIIATDSIKDVHGSYDLNDKKLIVNSRVINEFTNEWYSNKNFDQNATTLDRLYNLFLLEAIYHEINHAKQVKNADRKIDDSLHKVIRESVDLARRMPNNLTFDEIIMYRYYYMNVLIERNAEIMSLYTLIKNNNYIGLFNETELSYLREGLIHLIKFGYHGKANPVYTYYNLIKKNKEYRKLDFTEGYPLITTLSWGLPINGKVDDKVKELKMSINV